jgi:hypothetical protein
MSRLPAEAQRYFTAPPSEMARGRQVAATPRGFGGISTGWLIAGAVVLGLGALAWYSLGPDLRRYMKIRNM